MFHRIAGIIVFAVCTSVQFANASDVNTPTGPYLGTVLVNPSSGIPTTPAGAVANSMAPSVVALSTTAAVVLAASSNPISRTVCNDDATITEYFGPATVTNAGANGVKLTAGQCWDFSHNTAAIYGVSASATPNARVVQY